MLKVENVRVNNIVGAVYSARNAMNSWNKSDSDWETDTLGKNDLDLAKRLVRAGSDHAKYLRMITVTFDLIAPLYFYKQFDQYKVGVTTNSCSTMHKIHAKEFTLYDFSHEHLGYDGMKHLEETINLLNFYRDKFNDGTEWNGMTKKDFWWQMIQLLPTSYNQKRTVQLNYQVLKNMYHARKAHKLDEWKEFCKWIETLQYFREICLEESK